MFLRTLVAVAAALALAPAASAQVAQYHLDGSGSDSSGNGLHAVPAGSPEGVADGRFGSAFRFGDAADAFSVSANPLLQPALVSLVAWVRSPTVPGKVQSVVSQGGQFQCSHASYSFYTGGNADQPGIRFYIWNGVTAGVAGPAPGTMWDGAWHQIVGTYDGAFTRLYLDRTEVGAAAIAGLISYGLTTNGFAIGNAPPSGCLENTSFPGDIDEVSVYDRPLTLAEIEALPGGPPPPPPPTPTPTPTRTPTPAPPPSPPPPPPAIGDADADGIPDDQDTLPSGNLPPVAGQRVRSVADSGALQVKLPGQSAFVALKGAAALPVGTIVDARQGALTITAATNAAGTNTGNAKLAAGIFQIRQRRVQGAAAAATDIVLRTPAGAARACAPKAKRKPKKGVVRTLAVTTTKGLFNAIPARGSIKGVNASYTVSDTCSGTLTKVSKGRVSVTVGKRTRTVSAGERYLIKARLFGARRSRT